MTNKKTKRALLASVMAMLLCFTMLLGTTFAWFTDSASTAVNKIQAGTLDVQLLAEDGTSLDGETLSWQKAAGHENEDVLWEPGCTYKLQPIVIKNAGNLALKYKIVITGIQGDAELNEAIEWTITNNTSAITALDEDHPLAAGTSDTLTISGHMKESAGNEYQGLSIDGIGITVLATQDTVESDSFNNQYDKDATYTISVNSINELVSSFENMTEATVFDATGISIDVDTVGTTTDEIIVPTFSIPTGATVKGVEFKFGASMISAEATAFSDTVVFDECDIVTADADDTDGMPAMAIVGEMGTSVSSTKYVFNNCTFEGYVMLIGINAEFNNCTFVLSNEKDGATYCSFGEYVFNNCTFNYEGGTNEIATSSIYAESHATVTLKDCTLIGASYGNSADSTITVE